MVLKYLSFVAASLAIVAATSGCSYLFGPKPDDAKPFVKKSADDCVQNVPADVKAWLKDGKADIAATVDCSVGALNDFGRHVAGKTKGVYTQTELKEFISEYLVAPDSPNAGDVGTMTEQIFNVKQILLGGSGTLVTSDELARLKSILLRAKPLLVAVSPHIKTLLFGAQTATSSDVTNASTNLTQLFELLAQEFDRAESGRPEMGFRELLTSAHALGLQNESVSEWIPLAEALKVLILAGDADSLRPREWAPMIRTIAQSWGLALRIKYNLANNPDVFDSDFPMTEQTLRQIVALLDQSVQAHQGSIPNEVFEKLIDALGVKQLLPAIKGHYAGAQSLKEALPIAFGKLFYGRSHSDYVAQSQHFGTAQLSRVHEIVDDWIAGQLLINTSMNKQRSMGITQFGQTIAGLNVARATFVDDTTFVMAQRAQKQLLQFVSKGRPPIHDSEGRLIVVTRKELPDIQKSDLDLMNGTRILIESVLIGWTHDPLNAKGIVGMTAAETQEAYIDLRNLGRDFNFIDIRSNQAGTRTFMENAIFMSSSDGNGYMGLQEGVEWFNFVMSGGTVADKMWHDLEGPCGSAKIDVLGRQKLNPQCFRKEFLRTWTQYMPNLPHLIEWANQDGTGERARVMLEALEKAGRNRGASDDLMDSSEYRSMMPIAHYLESIFARQDVNRNAVLDNDELWNMFPLLGPFIKQMGNGKANGVDMQKTIYSYILTFGEVPATDLPGMIKIAGWYLLHGMFKESADREKVLGVIGAFPDAAKNTRLQAIKDYYNNNDDSLRALINRREKTNALKLADLFGCLPEAAPILGEDMAAKSSVLTPSGKKIGVSAFTTKMMALIDSDPRLEIYCLPF
jgi:hypothetical protein